MKLPTKFQIGEKVLVSGYEGVREITAVTIKSDFSALYSIDCCAWSIPEDQVRALPRTFYVRLYQNANGTEDFGGLHTDRDTAINTGCGFRIVKLQEVVDE